MASHHRRLYVYFHFNCIHLDRCSCFDDIGAGSTHPQLIRILPYPINFPPCVQLWSLSDLTAAWGLRPRSSAATGKYVLSSFQHCLWFLSERWAVDCLSIPCRHWRQVSSAQFSNPYATVSTLMVRQCSFRNWRSYSRGLLDS